MANARKVKAIYANSRKCDRLDAQFLARIARLVPELLHPIEHNSDQAQRDLLPIKLCDTLVRQPVVMISYQRGSLKSVGVLLPVCSSASFPKQARAVLLEEYHPELLAMAEPVFAAIQSLGEQIAPFHRQPQAA